jgi:hypothetical protein
MRAASRLEEAEVFKPEPGVRYDLPAVFGPSELRGQANYARKRTVNYTFRTDPAVLEPLIPYHFQLDEPARITIASAMLIGVDWMAGRNYHNVRVSAHVTARSGQDIARGPFHLVDWETDSHPVIAGREYLGLAKIVGEIPEHEIGEEDTAFECYEYGTRLLRVQLSNLRRAPGEELKRVNSSGDTVILGWKYIPGPGGTVDADYPVKMVARGHTDELFTGDGSVVFDQPTWEQCPFSARIMQTLATIPVRETVSATVALSANSLLDRAAATRLDPVA